MLSGAYAGRLPSRDRPPDGAHNSRDLGELGDVKPVIHAALPPERAADAHRLMESSDFFGKIVLTTAPLHTAEHAP